MEEGEGLRDKTESEGACCPCCAIGPIGRGCLVKVGEQIAVQDRENGGTKEW